VGLDHVAHPRAGLVQGVLLEAVVLRRHRYRADHVLALQVARRDPFLLGEAVALVHRAYHLDLRQRLDFGGNGQTAHMLLDYSFDDMPAGQEAPITAL